MKPTLLEALPEKNAAAVGPQDAHHSNPNTDMIQPNLDEKNAAPADENRKVRVLLVDDEKPMRAMAKVIIESLGLEAAEAHTGEEAVSVYQESATKGQPFDIVIMDLALPGGMSGLEASRSIMELDPSASIMISSGYLNQNSRQPALSQGFAGVLPKPYTVDRLASEIHYILHRRNSESE